MDKVVHFEIPADDMERARDFYGNVFGWNLQDWPMADGTKYIGARSVEVDEATHLPKVAGAINGGIMPRTAFTQSPIIAMQVSSIDECIKKIEGKGGKVIRPKVDIGGMGFYAYVTDSEGNVIGIWEDAKK
jgi:hypothetical protein